MENKSIKNNLSSLFYRIYGSGDPVVLLHGFGEDGEIFNNLVSALETRFRIFVPDLVGTGKSEGSTEGCSMESMAEQIIWLMEEEKLTTVNLIGHSMGGYISMAFAEKYPEKLSRLGLFHSSALADNEEKKAARQKNIDFITKHGAAKFIEQSVPTLFSEKTKTEKPALVDSMVRQYATLTATSLIDYTRAMISRPERLDVLKHFPRPVMFLLGESDNAVPLEAGLKQSHILGISYIYICTNSGHLGMLEEPEFCVKSILDFLSRP